jgi:3-oxoacyl-[acyl-carrier protein] reductase
LDVRDKTIIITGAGGGIGRSLAQTLALRQARLALLDTDHAALIETESLVREAGGTARSYQASTAEEMAVTRAMDQILADFGSIDGLVNNAGITRDALLIKVENGVPVGKMSLAQWQSVIDVNLTGVFLCTREAVERMIRLGNGGVVVNVSSISRAGNLGQTNYSAAKAGVAAMTVTWAKELAGYGIRVGAVAPGFVHTAMVAAIKPEVLRRITAGIPLGRLATPAEVAAAVEFIFSNDFFTGRTLELDGGMRL